MINLAKLIGEALYGKEFEVEYNDIELGAEVDDVEVYKRDGELGIKVEASAMIYDTELVVIGDFDLRDSIIDLNEEEYDIEYA